MVSKLSSACNSGCDRPSDTQLMRKAVILGLGSTSRASPVPGTTLKQFFTQIWERTVIVGPTITQGL